MPRSVSPKVCWFTSPLTLTVLFPIQHSEVRQEVMSDGHSWNLLKLQALNLCPLSGGDLVPLRAV